MASTQTTIPGLRIDWRQIGSYLYADVIHVGSGLPVRRFDRQPITGGKRRFVARVGRHLAAHCWTLDVSIIAKTPCMYEDAQRITYEG